MPRDQHDDFEKGLVEHLARFEGREPERKRAKRIARTEGLDITIRVRERRMSHDVDLTFHTETISRLEAQQIAVRKARDMGYRIFAFVVRYH